jgi:predicted membrane-bound mannosyltransferase
MEPSIFGKLIITSLAVIIAGWLFQDQADRYKGRVARFFQRALTVVVTVAMVVCAGSVVAVIWGNN